MNRDLQMTDHAELARMQPPLLKANIFTYGNRNL
jgi:hypothetical protein